MAGLTVIDKQNLINIISQISKEINLQKDMLSKLDTEIGDGDHGFNMSSGFTSLANKLPEFSKLSIGQLLKKGGFELIKSIGGSAGAIFGTFFTGQASYYEKNLAGKTELNLEDFSQMLYEALIQIKRRGDAKLGDKTMVDALEPAVASLQRSVKEKHTLSRAFSDAASSARDGAESTKTMVGKHGRSKNLGERGIGFIDPGSVSTAIIFKTISDYIQGTN